MITKLHQAAIRVVLRDHGVVGSQAWCRSCDWVGPLHTPDAAAYPNEAAAADATRHRDETAD